MEPHLVVESVKFMILGMLVVFLFLYLLVWLMRWQAMLIARFFPEPPRMEKPRKFGGFPDEEAQEESRRVAVIVAAIREYRKTAQRRKGD